MIGIIFTEFLELVEDQFGYAMVDRLLSECHLQSQGVYTSVGRYNFEELMVMVAKLSDITQVAKDDLVKLFGRTLFPKLINTHGNLIENIDDSLDLVCQIDNSIHVEVFKLYPNAELPVFRTRRISHNQLELIYQSTKPLAKFAEGLLYGCAEHFGEVFEISRSPETENCETHVCFNIIRHAK